MNDMEHKLNAKTLILFIDKLCLKVWGPLQFYSTPWAGRRAFKAKQGKLLFNEGDF